MKVTIALLSTFAAVAVALPVATTEAVEVSIPITLSLIFALISLIACKSLLLTQDNQARYIVRPGDDRGPIVTVPEIVPGTGQQRAEDLINDVCEAFYCS
jgi:hypothetical protein